MASFRTGQRVKLVRPSDPQNMGKVGTIVAFVSLPLGAHIVWSDGREKIAKRINCNVLVAYDVDEHCKPDNTDRLEPIQDDGRKVISWDAMKDLWQPNHQSAPA